MLKSIVARGVDCGWQMAYDDRDERAVVDATRLDLCSHTVPIASPNTTASLTDVTMGVIAVSEHCDERDRDGEHET
jgi:hypothetical protein